MDTEDITDIFDSSLTTIFDIPPIGFAPDHSTGLYVYNPSPLPSIHASDSTIPSSSVPPCSGTSQAGPSSRPIELKLPQPPSNLYTTLQANLIWPSALYLADLIVHRQVDVKGKKVAELGAGAGLPGIVGLREGGAAGVVSTDWGVEEVLSVLEDNFTRACQGDNPIKAEKEVGKGRSDVRAGDRDLMNQWKVVGHQWGTDPAPLLNALSSATTEGTTADGSSSSTISDKSDQAHRIETVDHSDSDGRFGVLLLADVLWTTSSHSVLLDSISKLLRPQNTQAQAYGVAHITAGLHTGRGPVERFIASAKERGMKITMVREVRLGRNGWEEYDESLAKAGEEERGVVVYFTLRL
ncbi:hypothetical protein IAT40_007489 [Kwoniella sp. CBS 6097]